MSKIFVRERQHVTERAGRPRFAIVGVQGADVKIFRKHVRKAELETIAQATGAELVYLPLGAREHGTETTGGRRRRAHRRQEA